MKLFVFIVRQMSVIPFVLLKNFEFEIDFLFLWPLNIVKNIETRFYLNIENIQKDSYNIIDGPRKKMSWERKLRYRYIEE